MYFEDKSVNSDTVSEDAVISNADKHFIDDELFQRLLTVRDDIYDVTQVRPTIRKLVNLIIDKADLKAIKDQLTKQYS